MLPLSCDCGWFLESAHDPALSVHHSTFGRTLLHADHHWQRLKYIAFVKARHSEFLMYDLGPLRYFLEILLVLLLLMSALLRLL